ncbi:MAG: hypothetical protein AB7K64_17890 [Variibacter sp.]|jgi:hypothetical protein
MVAAISVISLVSGACAAYSAPMLPERTEFLEWCGGALLIAGLAMIGGGLRFYC